MHCLITLPSLDLDLKNRINICRAVTNIANWSKTKFSYVHYYLWQIEYGKDKWSEN